MERRLWGEKAVERGGCGERTGEEEVVMLLLRLLLDLLLLDLHGQLEPLVEMRG